MVLILINALTTTKNQRISCIRCPRVRCALRMDFMNYEQNIYLVSIMQMALTGFFRLPDCILSWLRRGYLHKRAYGCKWQVGGPSDYSCKLSHPYKCGITQNVGRKFNWVSANNGWFTHQMTFCWWQCGDWFSQRIRRGNMIATIGEPLTRMSLNRVGIPTPKKTNSEHFVCSTLEIITYIKTSDKI